MYHIKDLRLTTITKVSKIMQPKHNFVIRSENRTTALRDFDDSKLLSDHKCIRFEINAKKSKNLKKKITLRKTLDIDIAELKNDVKEHLYSKYSMMINSAK